MGRNTVMNNLIRKCPYCRGNVLLRNYKGTKINVPKHRKEKHPVYICENFPECYSYIGCVPHTTAPLSSLANDKNRKYRDQAHQEFDKLWKKKKMTRTEAYAWLADSMELSDKKAHMSRFTTHQCLQAVQKIKNVSFKESIRKYNDIVVFGLDWVVPRVIKYGPRILKFDHTNEHSIFYKDVVKITKKRFQFEKVFYQIREERLFDLLEKGQMFIL